MLIKTSGIKINVSPSENIFSSKNMIVFLHGFTGSLKDWEELRYKTDPAYSTLTVDIIGHGLSDSPEDISHYFTDSIISQLSDVISYFTTEKIVLTGYSMGGRAALSFAAKYPQKIRGLILESVSPGIQDLEERKKRKLSDDELAEYISSNPIDNFIDMWMNLELFDSQKSLPKKNLQLIRKRKILNSKLGLSNILRGFGTGVMPQLYDHLKNISAPTLLITGELDKKFTTINNRIVNQFPNAVHENIKNAGHNVLLERPGEFASLMNKYLTSF